MLATLFIITMALLGEEEGILYQIMGLNIINLVFTACFTHQDKITFY